MSSTNRGKKRNANDKYPTPAWCTEALCKHYDLTKYKKLLEPCSGTNAIVDELKMHLDPDLEIVTNDLVLSEPSEHHYNFIKEWEYFIDKKIEIVVTNPPYLYALEFIENSLKICDKAIFLLRVNFLGSKKRKEFWAKGLCEHIVVLSQRPSFIGKGTDSTEYAWFIFNNKSTKKPTTIEVI